MPIVPLSTEVKIYTPNGIDSDSAITSDKSGDTNCFFDKDLRTAFETVGAAGDFGKDLQLDITFKVGAVETEFKINSLLLLHHNWREFDFYVWESSVYVKVLGSTDNTSSNKFYFFGLRTTSRIRLIVKKTILPNREKNIAELVVNRLRYYLSENPTTVDFVYREKRTILELGNGQRRIAYTRFTQNRLTKWGARVFVTQLPLSELHDLECLRNEGQPFLIQIEAATNRPSEIHYVNWVNPFQYNYTSDWKGLGYDLTMELEEV